MELLNRLSVRSKLVIVLVLAAVSLVVTIGASTSIMRGRMIEDRMAKLHAVVDIASGLAEQLEEQAKAGTLTRDHAIERFKEAVTAMWYDGRRGYLAIGQLDGLWLINPVAPRVAGTRGSMMPDGKMSILDWLITSVGSADEGVAAYDYPKPGEAEKLPKLTYARKFKPWNLLITSGVWIDAIDSAYRRTVLHLAGVGVLILLIMAGLVLALSRNIAGALTRLSRKMKSVVAGDLSISIEEVSRGDEIGQMAKSLEVFRENALAVRRLEAERIEITEEGERSKKQALHALADAFEKRVSGVVQSVSNASQAMREDARLIATSIPGTQLQAAAVASGAEQSATNVQAVASASAEMTASIAEIGRQVTQASQIAKNAAQETQEANQKVFALSDAAQKIEEVVSLIHQIASQTNLLALNATIESARAGDAGRGFSVVAAEVKDLATQTSLATEDIRSQINAIQGDTSEVVVAIGRISQTISRVDEISTAIAAAMEEQAAATQEITRNVQQVAESSNQVSENIEGVSSVVTETDQAASNLLKSADVLVDEARNLQSEMAHFLASVRAA